MVSFVCIIYVSSALLLYLHDKHCVNNLFVDAVQKSFSEATIRENCGYTLKFAPDQMEAGKRYLSSIENVINTLQQLLIFKFRRRV